LVGRSTWRGKAIKVYAASGKGGRSSSISIRWNWAALSPAPPDRHRLKISLCRRPARAAAVLRVLGWQRVRRDLSPCVGPSRSPGAAAACPDDSETVGGGDGIGGDLRLPASSCGLRNVGGASVLRRHLHHKIKEIDPARTKWDLPRRRPFGRGANDPPRFYTNREELRFAGETLYVADTNNTRFSNGPISNRQGRDAGNAGLTPPASGKHRGLERRGAQADSGAAQRVSPRKQSPFEASLEIPKNYKLNSLAPDNLSHHQSRRAPRWSPPKNWSSETQIDPPADGLHRPSRLPAFGIAHPWTGEHCN